jgi:predicted extracellular nuclease
MKLVLLNLRMKNIFLCLFILLLFSCQENDSKEIILEHSDKTISSINTLKSYDNHPIVFYNVENLFDTINDPSTNDDEFTPEGSKKWGAKRYNDKLNKLSKVLASPSENNPLFIGFAEIENRFVILDLIQTGRLSNTKYRIAHFNSPDRRGIDVALAFDLERFFLLHSEAYPIKIEGDDNFKTRDVLYVKGLLKDSIELHVFVNHWSSRRGGQKKSEHKRILAAQKLKHKSDSILNKNPDANILFMGDFNDYPTNKSINEVLGAKAIHEASPENFTNLLAPQHAEQRGTHNYRGKWGVLDQILVSPSIIEGKTLSIKNNEAHILYKDFLLYEHPNGDKSPSKTYGGPNYYGGYSDHLPVYCFLHQTAK